MEQLLIVDDSGKLISGAELPEELENKTWEGLVEFVLGKGFGVCNTSIDNPETTYHSTISTLVEKIEELDRKLKKVLAYMEANERMRKLENWNKQQHLQNLQGIG